MGCHSWDMLVTSMEKKKIEKKNIGGNSSKSLHF
jgi:hypothetical protein